MKRRSLLKGALALLAAPLVTLRAAVAKEEKGVTKRWAGGKCPALVTEKLRNVGMTNISMALLAYHWDNKDRWDNPDNWFPRGVPTKKDDVIIQIPEGVDEVHIAFTTDDHVCRDLDVNGDGTVDVSGDGSLTCRDFAGIWTMKYPGAATLRRGNTTLELRLAYWGQAAEGKDA